LSWNSIKYTRIEYQDSPWKHLQGMVRWMQPVFTRYPFSHFNKSRIYIFRFWLFWYLHINCYRCILSLFVVITYWFIFEYWFLSYFSFFSNLYVNLLLQIQIFLNYDTAIVWDNLSACTTIIFKVSVWFNVLAQNFVQILMIMISFKVRINSVISHYWVALL
jgi:hypothetical protein